jgi:hypothetical protein
VEVFDRVAAQKAGVGGVLLRVERADGLVGAGPVVVDVDVSGFAGAFGGDWASRLRLYRFPSCVLTSPEAEACGTPTPVDSSVLNNTTLRLTATVDAASEPVVVTDPSAQRLAEIDGFTVDETQVLAVMAAGSSSDTGDFSKTPFAASYQWQAGTSGADFSWRYGIDVPPVPGGLEPSISLSYSSGAVDGQTAGKNVQPGWLGEGWDYQPGFIDRSYRPCVDDQNPATPYYTNATADLCWRLPNARLVWGGKSTELIPDDTTGTWHAADDDGMRVEKVSADWSTADLMLSPGDFTGDGNPDVIYRRPADGRLFLVRGDGAGGWLNGGAAEWINSGWNIANAIVSPGDFTGDGHPDLIYRRASDGDLILARGDGLGGFTGTATDINAGWNIANIIFSPGDWDGDGKSDLIYRRASDSTMWMARGNGTGGFYAGLTQVLGSGWGAANLIMSPGDFSGDGHPDVLYRRASDNALMMVKGNGTGGVIGSAVQIGTGWSTADVIFSGGDHNGDVKADVLWRHASTNDVFLVAGNGAGGWVTGNSVNMTEAVRTGTGDDEYWKITTTDGTQYFFGRVRLPGWTSDSGPLGGRPETDSQWTVPVFANHAGEPCFRTTGFTGSWCSQAWR